MKSHNLWGGGSSFFRLKLYICVIFAIVAAAMILTSCKNTATEPDKPVKPAPIPKLANDTTLTFPTGKMEINQNGKKLEGTDKTNKTTVILQAGTPSEITIKYNIDSGKTVYNVVATITEASVARSADSTTPVTHFVPYSAETTGVAYIVRGDTEFDVTEHDAKADEKFDNGNVFSTVKYTPAETPYKVCVNFLGNKEYYFDAIEKWFSFGDSNRKSGGSIVKKLNENSSKTSLHDFLINSTAVPESTVTPPHAVVCNFGEKEAGEDNFDSALFIQEYKALVSYLTSIKNTERTGIGFTTKVVLLGLPENAKDKNAKAVNAAIKKVATESGAAFVDIAEVEKQARNAYPQKAEYDKSNSVTTTCSIPNCQFHSETDDATKYAKRKVAEEVFLSFYLDVEAVATPDQTVSTTPRQKWGGTDDGNQDSVKKNLINSVKNNSKTAYPQVIFTGDSITDFFDGYPNENYNTKEYWKNNIGYGDDAQLGTGTSAIYRALDLGNSGDLSQSLLYRWKKDSSDSASGAYTDAFGFGDSVKAISLLIGTNNIAPNGITDKNSGASKYQERPLSATETVRGIEEVIKVLQEGFPKAKILLMAVYPRGCNTQKYQYIDFTRLQVMAINRMLQNKYGENGTAKNNNIILVDTYEKYLKPCGCQHMEYFVGNENASTGSNGDNIHLCAKGYQEIWWPTVEPILEKLCGVKPSIKITTPTGNILQNGIPVRLPEGCSASDVTCSVSGSAPFTAKLENGKIKITPNSSVTGSGTVTLTAKNNSQITGSITINSEDYWRYYNAGGTTYKFDLVKRFHFDSASDVALSGNKLTTGSSGCGKVSVFTSGATNDTNVVNSGENHYVTCSAQSNAGVALTCWNDNATFSKGSYDYVEIRFKSDANVASKIGLLSNGKLAFFYDAGKLKVTGGNGASGNLYIKTDEQAAVEVNAGFDDASAGWHTIGFWNNTSGNDCLLVSDGIATEKTLDNQNNLQFSLNNIEQSYSVISVVGTGVATDIDYIAFYKKVN